MDEGAAGVIGLTRNHSLYKTIVVKNAHEVPKNKVMPAHALNRGRNRSSSVVGMIPPIDINTLNVPIDSNDDCPTAKTIAQSQVTQQLDLQSDTPNIEEKRYNKDDLVYNIWPLREWFLGFTMIFISILSILFISLTKPLGVTEEAIHKQYWWLYLLAI